MIKNLKKLCFVCFIFCFFMNAVEKTEKGDKHFVLFVAGRNVSKWHKKNLDSIFNQTYTNYDLVYVDDYSDDGTGDLFRDYVSRQGFYLSEFYTNDIGSCVEIYRECKEKARKIIFIQNKERRYKMANQYDAIHTYCKESDIVVEIDADDWFATDDALSYVNNIYSDQNIWLTYGNYITFPEGEKIFTGQLSEKSARNAEFRVRDWRYTGLYTYYAGLFKLIFKSDLIYRGMVVKFKGKFVPLATDAHIIFPMLEMCRNGHFKYIEKVLYVLSRDRDKSVAYPKIMSLIRSELKAVVMRKTKYPALGIPLWDM